MVRILFTNSQIGSVIHSPRQIWILCPIMTTWRTSRSSSMAKDHSEAKTPMVWIKARTIEPPTNRRSSLWFKCRTPIFHTRTKLINTTSQLRTLSNNSTRCLWYQTTITSRRRITIAKIRARWSCWMCPPLKIFKNSHQLQRFRCLWQREPIRLNLLVNSNSKSPSSYLSMDISLRCNWTLQHNKTTEKHLTQLRSRIHSQFQIVNMTIIKRTITILLPRFSMRLLSSSKNSWQEPTAD